LKGKAGIQKSVDGQASYVNLACNATGPVHATESQATLVSQFDAFENYVAEAEKEGPENFPLYKWTKATVDNPVKRAKHIKTFALHVSGNEIYGKQVADALEADMQPLVGGELVTRVSKHDTNPANNLQVPAEYRS